MTKDRAINWETLNAYVDGELDAAERAAVARAVADEPVMARQVSALSRLKSAVAESAGAPPIRLPQPAKGRGHRLALAASVALALVAGGALFALMGKSPVPSALLARAWQVHRGWSAAKAEPVTSGVLLAGLARIGPSAYVPDLTAARLAIARVALVPVTREAQALLVGYRGTRGCRVSLMIFSTTLGLRESLQHLRGAAGQAYGWRAGKHGYLILNQGMAHGRFALVARTVHRTSIERQPVDAETRTALAKSRAESRPCFS